MGVEMIYSTKYRDLIKSTCEDQKIPFDWLYIYAQSFAESGQEIGNDIFEQDRNAKSPVGAIGIMQLMPENYQYIDPYDPNQNIIRGISLDLDFYNIWKLEEGIEKIKFMFASYNAGPEDILHAQTITGRNAQILTGRSSLATNIWDNVASYLHYVTGYQNAQQTINYVKRILNIYAELKGLENDK